MKRTPSLHGILLACALAAAPIFSSQAVVLMLDFGPTAVSGAALTESPYHAATGATETTWNTSVGTADVLSGLVYGDGSSATGITLNTGVTAASGSTILLGTQPSSSSTLGGGSNTGIYASPGVARDGIFNSATNTATGMQIGGLAAGTYEIYVVSRNTNQTSSTVYTQTLRYGTSASAGDFSFAAYDSAGVTYGSATSSTTWIEGENYVKATITLAAGEFLNLGMTGSGADTRGFVNSVQIFAIPEPSAGVLLGLLGVALLLVRRHRIS